MVAVVASGIEQVAYRAICAGIEYDGCPCCFEQEFPWIEDEARITGEINAALVLSEPRRPLFAVNLPAADARRARSSSSQGEARELYPSEEWALQELANRAA